MTRKPTILFVDGLWVEKHGIMSLIPQLERSRFSVHLRLTRNVRRLLASVAELEPDVVAFSVTTGWHEHALTMARAVRSRHPGVKILLGGPHVTYFPDVVLDPAVGVAFYGECDRELAPGLEALLDGVPAELVPNAAARRPGPVGTEVALGPLAPLAEDLDSLPLPDREHYYRHRFFRNSPYKSFIVSRGCPHDCAFCFNRKLRELYRGKGKFLRYRSPESVVEEALSLHRRFGMKLASFEDDLLTCDRGWLERLLTLWHRRVRVPYNLNATAQALTDESLVRLLKETGIWCVAFGIETGSETLRKTLLNKALTDDQVRRAGSLLKKHAVRFLTYNMFALPGERLDDALATVRLNREIGTRLARCTLFTPFPGTELGDRAAAGNGFPPGTNPRGRGGTIPVGEADALGRGGTIPGCGGTIPVGEADALGRGGTIPGCGGTIPVGEADALGRGGTIPGCGEMLFGRSALEGPEVARIERLQKLALLGMRSPAAEKLARFASAIPAGPVHDLVFWATYFDAVRDYMKTDTLHLLELGIRSMTDVL